MHENTNTWDKSPDCNKVCVWREVAWLWHRLGGRGEAPPASSSFAVCLSHACLSDHLQASVAASGSRQLYTLILIRNLGSFKFQTLIFLHTILSASVIIKTTFFLLILIVKTAKSLFLSQVCGFHHIAGPPRSGVSRLGRLCHCFQPLKQELWKIKNIYAEIIQTLSFHW